jgi:hypothetical protein
MYVTASELEASRFMLGLLRAIFLGFAAAVVFIMVILAVIPG